LFLTRAFAILIKATTAASADDVFSARPYFRAENPLKQLAAYHLDIDGPFRSIRNGKYFVNNGLTIRENPEKKGVFDGKYRETGLITPKGIMEIKRAGSQPSNKGPADWFTGAVRIDPLIQVPAPARVAGASVTFEPGARTAWHTHPLGQTLIVIAGCGRAQRWGGPIEEIRPGDVVWFAPGEKHWHGAAPSTAMTHIAIQEQIDGKVVDWMEKVTDEQFGATL
jgi:quercetin dioxygenase-like cupin family protein